MTEVRPIDANALLNDLKESVKAAREWREEAQDEEIRIRAEQAHGTFVECALRVKNAPTIEAEPVRHGRWIEESANEYYCSYCGKYAPIAKNMRHCDCSKWCKECGTKMDGGADNG